MKNHKSYRYLARTFQKSLLRSFCYPREMSQASPVLVSLPISALGSPVQVLHMLLCISQAIKKELLDEGSGDESGSGGESGSDSSDSEVGLSYCVSGLGSCLVYL